MGSAIFYCFRCNTQLREVHFEQGKAYRIDTWTCCADCAPEAVRQLPPDRVQLLLAQIQAKEKKPESRPGPRPARSAPVAPRKGPSLALLVGIGAGIAAVMFGIAIVATMPGSQERPVPPPPVRAVSPVPPETPERTALRKAQAFATRNPDDVAGQIREFEAVVLMGERTEVADEARQKLASLRNREKEEVDRALAALERELAEPLGAEAYGRALRILEAALARRPATLWKFGVEKRTRELQGEVDRAFESLRDKAKEARSREAQAEVDAALARVKRWGIPKYVEELGEALAAIVTRLDLDDCDTVSPPWKYVGGEEFPGAKGSLAIDAAVKHGGRGSFRLQGDFSGGGAYVGIWRDLTGSLGGRDIREIRLWVRTRAVHSVGVRIADGSDQVHQKHVDIPAAPDQWQEVVLRIQDLVGGEHWGGADDGRWHGPAKGLGINLGKNSLKPGDAKGEIWFDDMKVVFAPP